MNKNEKFVITINREAGSGGRTVGRKLAEKLGVKYCDKAIVEGLTKKFGLSIERIEEIKAQKKSWWTDINNYYNTLVNSASQPMDAQVKLDNTSIFETEKRIMNKENVSDEKARNIIAKLDADRETYIKKYEDTSRYDTRNYQLVISMDDLSEDDAVEVIMDYIDRTSKSK